jgi:hypothetical protein
MKPHHFEDALKVDKCFFSCDKDLLTGVQIPAQIFWLPHGPPPGPIDDAHVEVCEFLC